MPYVLSAAQLTAIAAIQTDIASAHTALDGLVAKFNSARADAITAGQADVAVAAWSARADVIAMDAVLTQRHAQWSRDLITLYSNAGPTVMGGGAGRR